MFLTGKKFFNKLKEWSEKGDVILDTRGLSNIKTKDGSAIEIIDENLPKDAVGMTYAAWDPLSYLYGLGYLSAKVKIGEDMFKVNFNRFLHIPYVDISVEGESPSEKMNEVLKKYF